MTLDNYCQLTTARSTFDCGWGGGLAPYQPQRCVSVWCCNDWHFVIVGRLLLAVTWNVPFSMWQTCDLAYFVD